jgi:hypothetical protein
LPAPTTRQRRLPNFRNAGNSLSFSAAKRARTLPNIPPDQGFYYYRTGRTGIQKSDFPDKPITIGRSPAVSRGCNIRRIAASISDYCRQKFFLFPVAFVFR